MAEFRRTALRTDSVPVIAAQHLSSATFTCLATECGTLVAQYPHGVFVRVPSLNPSGAPNDLVEVIEWARQRDYVWIRLDQDAEIVEGLASYWC